MVGLADFMRIPDKSNINSSNKLKPIIHQECTKPKESYHFNENFKMPYPGIEAYVFPSGPKHLSPCQDPFWRGQEIRQGNVRDEIEHDEKINFEEGEQ